MLRKFINFLILLPLVAILSIHLLGFFPHVHPLFDTFANVRLLTTAILFIMLFNLVMSGRGLWALISFSSALVGVFSFGFEAPAIAPQQGNFRIVQVDLDPLGYDVAKIVTWLNASNADVISLRANASDKIDLPQALNLAFPEHLVCKVNVQKQIFLLSRTPFSQAQCSKVGGLGWATLRVDGADLQIAAFALDYPYPGKQWEQLAAIESDLKNLNQPLIVAAHLNAMPWGNGAAQIAAASRTVPASGPIFTFQTFKIPILPLMQIFASPRLVVTTVKAGSDIGTSLPIIADFKL